VLEDAVDGERERHANLGTTGELALGRRPLPLLLRRRHRLTPAGRAADGRGAVGIDGRGAVGVDVTDLIGRGAGGVDVGRRAVGVDVGGRAVGVDVADLIGGRAVGVDVGGRTIGVDVADLIGGGAVGVDVALGGGAVGVDLADLAGVMAMVPVMTTVWPVSAAASKGAWAMSSTLAGPKPTRRSPPSTGRLHSRSAAT
jgi:hypothetical protein